MLVLSRRIGESFTIGDNMEVTVVDISGGKVVLGILAPKSIPIARMDAEEKEPRDSSINEKGYGRQQKKRLSDENK